MATLEASFLVLAHLLLYFSPSTSTTVENHGHNTYIVHIRAPEHVSTTSMAQEKLEQWYMSFLPPRMEVSSSRRSPFIHTYSASMFGFAANLTKRDAEYVEMKEGVLKVYQDEWLPLLTTHSPDFLALRRGEEGVWKKSGMGEGVIIGVLDTGIDFAHTSFDDSGMKPPPVRWRGSCGFTDVKCNNKIIGARMFVDATGLKSRAPVDQFGHGTHTASTAAGRSVVGANVLGSGNGTASGMAPRAHLAVYQVCARNGCSAADILAGMDAAIADGVDILSLSIDGRSKPFHEDAVAIGAFSAMRKGIFVSCAAGNSGPNSNTLSNDAPWILTVGASTMDRQMQAIVKLGDGRTLVGESAYQPSTLPALPLVYPEDGICFFNVPDMVGKIFVCDITGSPVEMGKFARGKGAVGFIVLGEHYTGHTTIAEAHVLPASYLDAPDVAYVRSYIKSSKNSTASIIFNGTSLGSTPAPTVAFFSSRGPSHASPGILKPDIIGPGVNVVAAWPFKVGPDDGYGPPIRGTDFFNVQSGTSMSTPHLSGIAAIIRSVHPKWSPAAIKSAIMTTAYVVDDHNNTILDENLKPAAHFTIGAGHVNPLKVTHPGLIYDIDETQYVLYLCGLGYTDHQVEIITLKKNACKNSSSKISEAELNYPSLAISASVGKLVVNRTVTNVGDAVSSYTVVVDMPKEVKISVSPAKIEFSALNEKKTFTVSLSWDTSTTKHAEGSFKWVSDKRVVRSPIVIF